MPRRPPPSALLLSKGPTPARGYPKFTLPAKPQRVLIPIQASPLSHLDSVLHRCALPSSSSEPNALLLPPAPTMAKRRQMSVSSETPPPPLVLERSQKYLFW
ncbi:hypothetical protein DACRYDRAFT_24541 [Dacryopinax primogenitus]|uniref:Uncharacterized protein n=1 Tax=Dacryopinax primogenitus (strain DJM 731) TaxID=1858805 RepID=M5FRX6_DACPD|nr:uncharacterized protein DACRYDRAFT_24541 [Dacryopinax primogenitus]EJT98518.1 hypothetical protein DACRYDRAFT_24541 [Dacryopinax primogenitus]